MIVWDVSKVRNNRKKYGWLFEKINYHNFYLIGRNILKNYKSIKNSCNYFELGRRGRGDRGSNLGRWWVCVCVFVYVDFTIDSLLVLTKIVNKVAWEEIRFVPEFNKKILDEKNTLLVSVFRSSSLTFTRSSSKDTFKRNKFIFIWYQSMFVIKAKYLTFQNKIKLTFNMIKNTAVQERWIETYKRNKQNMAFTMKRTTQFTLYIADNKEVSTMNVDV
uniref:Uncharacterized protein n=1 Tax=Timema bartmani TaxID=61472 RepID=A0A7R9HX48_9NEOP|nr:unnamed protein product [Timema bartmani]